MLKEHLLTDLGFGSWAVLNNSGSLSSSPSIITHPHNAYLEIYVNFGLFGAIAFFTTVVIAFKLSWSILRSLSRDTWYGLGMGVILAPFLSAVGGFIESASIGLPLIGRDVYFYIVSLVFWLLLSLLVISYRISRQPHGTT